LKKSLSVGLFLLSAAPLPCLGQKGGEVGIFAEALRAQVNFLGLGGRLSFNASPRVQLEGELSSGYKHIYTPLPGVGGKVTTASTALTTATILFGPKLQSALGPVCIFVTLKGGIIGFEVNSRGPTTGIVPPYGPSGNAFKRAVYPGIGLERNFGRIGLRLDVGDLIYFDGGANNSLRITFGPSIRL
jgi:hypothetical protein